MSDTRFLGRIFIYVFGAVVLAGLGVVVLARTVAGGGAQWLFLAIAVFAIGSSAFLGLLARYGRWAYVRDLGLRLGSSSGSIIPWSNVVSVVLYRSHNDFLFVAGFAEEVGSKLMVFHASPKATPAFEDYLKDRLAPAKLIEGSRRFSFPIAKAG